MAAGLTLNSEDLNEYGAPRARAASEHRRLYYPIEMVRALVGVWLFAGCRIDEIRRLDVNCIERDEGRDDKTGETFPICLLRVPQNKTSRPFTKPVDPIVGQLIDAWKHVRPPQPKIVDRKTGEHREFLFCVRGAQIGRAYLNDTVLPALCRKAGIRKGLPRRADQPPRPVHHRHPTAQRTRATIHCRPQGMIGAQALL